MKRSYPRTILTLTMLASLLLGATAFAQETVRIGGSGTGLGTLKKIIVAFRKKNPGIQVAIQSSIGSGGAIKAVAQGALELGVVSRPLSKEEVGLGLTVLPFAKTPFVFAVSKNVPVANLNREEISKILAGEMRTWPNGKDVRVVLRPAADSDTLVARSLSPEIAAALDAALSRPGMLIALTDQDNAQTIATTPGAIGFSTLAQIATEDLPLKALSLDGVVPSTDNVENGTYPARKVLSLVVKPDPSPAARIFLDFMRSPEAQGILARAGSIPIARKR